MRTLLPPLTLLVLALSGCAPSPWYTGNSQGGLAPGVVPRDSFGRPVMKNGTMEYVLPPPAATATGEQQASRRLPGVIYFEDLRYGSAAPAPTALADTTVKPGQ